MSNKTNAATNETVKIDRFEKVGKVLDGVKRTAESKISQWEEGDKPKYEAMTLFGKTLKGSSGLLGSRLGEIASVIKPTFAEEVKSGTFSEDTLRAVLSVLSACETLGTLYLADAEGGARKRVVTSGIAHADTLTAYNGARQTVGLDAMPEADYTGLIRDGIDKRDEKEASKK